MCMVRLTIWTPLYTMSKTRNSDVLIQWCQNYLLLYHVIISHISRLISECRQRLYKSQNELTTLTMYLMIMIKITVLEEYEMLNSQWPAIYKSPFKTTGVSGIQKSKNLDTLGQFHWPLSLVNCFSFSSVSIPLANL